MLEVVKLAAGFSFVFRNMSDITWWRRSTPKRKKIILTASKPEK
jgi:hypothetical protein